MSGGLVTAAYIVAAILFIFSLAGLSKHETSRQGNNFGIAGMAIALVATIFGPDLRQRCLDSGGDDYWWGDRYPSGETR